MPAPPNDSDDQHTINIEDLLEDGQLPSQSYSAATERYPISSNEVWVNLTSIPSTPPPLQEWSSVAINPIVKGLKNIPLGVDPNNPYNFSYEHSVGAVVGLRKG
jgi:hypothetical protein